MPYACVVHCILQHQCNVVENKRNVTGYISDVYLLAYLGQTDLAASLCQKLCLLLPESACCAALAGPSYVEYPGLQHESCLGTCYSRGMLRDNETLDDYS